MCARKESVHVLYSRRFPTPRFDVQEDHPEAFDFFRADLSNDWEPSFFRSLADVDAALIVGGGHSSYLAGLVCLGRRIPILALGIFGGSAHRVLDAIVQAGTPLRQEDVELLARPEWSAASARALVESLVTQKASLDKERDEVQAQRRTRRRSQNAAVALALFAVASLLIPTALVVKKADTWPELVLLFAAPLIAGASGGTIRTLLPRTNDVEVSTLGSAALGAVAGGITGLLYLSAQLTSSVEHTLGALTARQYQTFVLSPSPSGSWPCSRSTPSTRSSSAPAPPTHEISDSRRSIDESSVAMKMPSVVRQRRPLVPVGLTRHVRETSWQ